MDLKASNDTIQHYSDCILATSFKSSITDGIDMLGKNIHRRNEQNFNTLRRKIQRARSFVYDMHVISTAPSTLLTSEGRADIQNKAVVFSMKIN